MCKFLITIFLFLITSPLFAVDCLSYKKNPKVLIDIPSWSKVINQPDTPMDKLHGNVEANLVNNYELVIDVMPVQGGYCISLKGVEAIIGYDSFVVNIDKEHKKNSCTYNAVLNHEDKHISVYLGIISDFKNEIKKSLYSAADSVMPVFIKSEKEIDKVTEMLNSEFSSHPDLLLLSQKINAAQEIRNQQIDNNETNKELFSCYK